MTRNRAMVGMAARMKGFVSRESVLFRAGRLPSEMTFHCSNLIKISIDMYLQCFLRAGIFQFISFLSVLLSAALTHSHGRTWQNLII
jgi:hypothetical protein